MSRALAAAMLGVFSSGALLGQPAEPAPKFDIADVHVSPGENWVKTPGHSMQGGLLQSGRYELRRATLLDVIRVAYAVDVDKIHGGLRWLDYDRLEVAPRLAPEPARKPFAPCFRLFWQIDSSLLSSPIRGPWRHMCFR